MFLILSTHIKVKNMTDKSKLMKIKDVLMATQMSRSRLYQLIKEGAFPRQHKNGVRAVVLVRQEVEDWVDKVIADC